LNKKLLIGISALVALSVWLVFAFSNDPKAANVSFVPPVYADDHTANGGPGIDSCTDSCLYDAVILTDLPAWPYYCQTALSVKHKEYDQLECCCHEVSSIWVEIWTNQGGCACDVAWQCEKEGSYLGNPCGYDLYITPIFLYPDNTTFYYKFWDHADETNCVCSGSFMTECW